MRFLRECLPGRFERNSRDARRAGGLQPRCLRALRAQPGIRYDELARGILHFATSERDFEVLARHAEAMRALGIRRAR